MEREMERDMERATAKTLMLAWSHVIDFNELLAVYGNAGPGWAVLFLGKEPKTEVGSWLYDMEKLAIVNGYDVIMLSDEFDSIGLLPTKPED